MIPFNQPSKTKIKIIAFSLHFLKMVNEFYLPKHPKDMMLDTVLSPLQ